MGNAVSSARIVGVLARYAAETNGKAEQLPDGSLDRALLAEARGACDEIAYRLGLQSELFAEEYAVARAKAIKAGKVQE